MPLCRPAGSSHAATSLPVPRDPCLSACERTWRPSLVLSEGLDVGEAGSCQPGPRPPPRFPAPGRSRYPGGGGCQDCLRIHSFRRLCVRVRPYTNPWGSHSAGRATPALGGVHHSNPLSSPHLTTRGGGEGPGSRPAGLTHIRPHRGLQGSGTHGEKQSSVTFKIRIFTENECFLKTDISPRCTTDGRHHSRNAPTQP